MIAAFQNNVAFLSPLKGMTEDEVRAYRNAYDPDKMGGEPEAEVQNDPGAENA